MLCEFYNLVILCFFFSVLLARFEASTVVGGGVIVSHSSFRTKSGFLCKNAFRDAVAFFKASCTSCFLASMLDPSIGLDIIKV